MTSTTNSSAVQARETDDTKSRHDWQQSNDSTTPNSSERVVLDGTDQVSTEKTEKSQKEFIKCKNPVTISSLNTRTLNPTGRVDELTYLAKAHSIDVISIQDHKFHHPDDDIKYHQKQLGYQLLTVSCWKNDVNAAVGGVGFLLSPKAHECLSNIEKISSRIMIVELNSNPVTTIICCYSPHNSSPEEELSEFYNDLQTVCSSVPAHNLLLLCGDFNARLGKGDAQFTYHTNTNRNGEKFADFLTEHNLCATNTKFMNKPNKLWTFQHPSGTKAQLDYILVRKKWINSVKNSRAYSSFNSVLSDHRIVSAKIQLSLRTQKKKPGNPMNHIDWPLVFSDASLTNSYTVEVKNRFSELCPEDSNPHDKYQLLTKCVEEVAIKSLPKKRKRKEKSLSALDSIEKARRELENANNLHTQSPTALTKEKVEETRKKLQDAYDIATAEHLQEQINNLTSLHSSHQHSAAWKTINAITGRKDKPTVTVQGGSAEKRKEGWLKHFKNLLGEAPKVTPNLPRIKVAETLNISTKNFTIKELLKVTDHLPKKKKTGSDNIPPIIWKDPQFHEQLLELCNHVLNTFDAPQLWLNSEIVPLPKKGNLTLQQNYRGISLTQIAAKIYNKLLLNRIFPAVNPILRRNQNGFRKGRSTIAQILALRRIIEEMKFGNKELTIVFVDFKKAFDSINREVMFEILGLYGIPDKIIKAIKALYTNTKSRVITPDGETELFDIVAGVLQGDTLAPLLFVIVLDYVLRISLDANKTKGLLLKPKRSSRHPAEYLTDLDFADDLAIPSNSVADAETLLQALEEAATHVGLYCNASKTEFTSTSHNPTITTYAGNLIKHVQDFVYLGSHIMDSEKDFQIRKALAWSACNKLGKIWKSSLARKLKIEVFRATVEPILMYGAETWTMSARMQKRLDGCYTNLLRRAQNLSWRDHHTLDQIYGSIPKLSIQLAQRRARFAGHCFRADDEVISDLVLWKATNSRKLKYPDMISRDTGILVEDLPTAMADRDCWRSVVFGISPTGES